MASSAPLPPTPSLVSGFLSVCTPQGGEGWLICDALWRRAPRPLGALRSDPRGLGVISPAHPEGNPTLEPVPLSSAASGKGLNLLHSSPNQGSLTLGLKDGEGFWVQVLSGGSGQQEAKGSGARAPLKAPGKGPMTLGSAGLHWEQLSKPFKSSKAGLKGKMTSALSTAPPKREAPKALRKEGWRVGWERESGQKPKRRGQYQRVVPRYFFRPTWPPFPSAHSWTPAWGTAMSEGLRAWV